MRNLLSSTRPAVTMTLLVVALAAVACGSAADDSADAKPEIQAFLEEFLPVLGQAYAERDAWLIEPFVAPKEIARVGKRIDELSAQGQVYVPTLRTVTIEDVNVWNNSNAFVSTFETWDVQRLAAGTDQIVGEALEQPNRVKYQMKHDTDGWRVLYRTIVE